MTPDAYKTFQGPVCEVLRRESTDAPGKRSVLCAAGIVEVDEEEAVVGKIITVSTVNGRRTV